MKVRRYGRVGLIAGFGSTVCASSGCVGACAVSEIPSEWLLVDSSPQIN
jgi:hypothetical protein